MGQLKTGLVNKSFLSKVLFCVGLYLYTIAVATASSLQLTDSEQDWINAHPQITFANEIDWPPFDYVEDGFAAGYSIDVVRLIAKKAGIKIKFVNGYTWKELIQQFKAGKIDVMPAMYIDSEREKYTLFTKSYYSHPSVMVVHKDSQGINNINDLSGKRVAGIAGFSVTTALENNIKNVRIVEVNNLLEGLMMVSLGKADAFIDSIGTVTYHLENNYIPNVRLISNVEHAAINNPDLHMGVSKDNEILKNILDKGLAAISREEKHALRLRWLHSPDTPKSKLHIFRDKLIEKLSKKEQAWLDTKPVVHLGVDSSWPPIEWIDDKGNYQGMTSDYIKFLEAVSGIKIKPPEPLAWTKVLDKVKSGTIDLIPAVVETAARKKYLNFSQPYLNFPFVIFTRNDAAPVSGLSDLYAKRVGIEKNYSSRDDLKRDHQELDFIDFNTTESILEALSVGDIDAYIGNLTVAVYLINREGLTNIKVAATTDYNFKLSVGIRKTLPELHGIINKALALMSDAQRNKIHQKWLKLDFKVGVDYKLVIRMSIIFALLILIILAWLIIAERQKKILKLAKIETEKANQKLTEVDQLKSMFIASVSHELRTPLNAVIGFSSVMMNGLYGVLDDRYQDYAVRIHKSGEHLLSLITDIIDISKIESGNLDIIKTEFMLDDIVDEAVINLQQLADSKNLKINVNVVKGMRLVTDKRRLLQCIINFVSNAVKYSEKGVITVSAVESKDAVTCTVTDTGIGISKEDINRLFEPFERFESHIKVKAGGTGLGLYLTNKIVTEMLQGQIGAESKLGEGSSFWIKIPKVIN